MIDVSKLSHRDRWKLYFAIGALRAIDRDDDEMDHFRYSGALNEDLTKPVKEGTFKAPSYEEVYERFQEIFGFSCDDVRQIDTVSPVEIEFI